MKAKIPLIIGVVLLVAIIVAVVVIGSSLDAIIKKGIETVGPQLTKTTIKLDSFHLSILTGATTVKGFVVGSPEGFKAPNAISIGTIAVGVDPTTILKDKVVVRSIVMEAPEITFEGDLLGGNNLSKIMESVNAVNKNQIQKAGSTNQVGVAPSRKIEVDDFIITGAKVHGDITAIGNKPIKLNITLPDIHLNNLGQGPAGITTTDLTRRVLSAVITATIKAVTAEASGLGKSVSDAAGKAATDSVNKITKGIGGALGK
jgi:hypothetical protein